MSCLKAQVNDIKTDKKTQNLTIRMPVAEYGYLQRYAEANDLTISDLVRKAVRAYISILVKKEKQKGAK